MTHIQITGSAINADKPRDLTTRGAILFSRVHGIDLITQHETRINQGALVIGAGKPVTVADLGAMVSGLEGATSIGWIEPDVLAMNGQQMVWTLPAKVRPIWFNFSGKVTKVVAPWPQLVLIARKTGELRVFAIAGDERPAPKSVLFHAPLMNINERGGMCFGSVEQPEFSLENRVAFSNALTRSRFTHVNHDQTFKSDAKQGVSNEAHIKMWKDLRGLERFPVELLASTKMTLGEALRYV